MKDGLFTAVIYIIILAGIYWLIGAFPEAAACMNFKAGVC